LFSDAHIFLSTLFARCNPEAYLTLTAIHPTENKPVPSRHIRLNDAVALADALERLHTANDMGWGAYFGLATRKSGLTRWQRGDMNTLIEVPALIADIDEPPNVALPRVKAFPILPSCIVSSGHGLHAYWLLDQPTTDMQVVNAIHRGLAQALKGDYLTAATALRLPGSLNTKRNATAPCVVLECNWSRCYRLADFDRFRKGDISPKSQHKHQSNPGNSPPAPLSPAVIQQVGDILLSRGYTWRGTWLNGTCLQAHLHKHADQRPSFGFNTATGYGYCFVCGSILLKTLGRVLEILT